MTIDQKNVRLLGGVSLGAAAAAMLFATPALAQDEPVQDNKRAEGSDIIVTASKRAQNVDKVSIAISVVDAQALDDKQIVTLEDLQVAVPALTIGNDFAFAKLYMRGLGLNSSLPGLDPSVTLHVDGAVVCRSRRSSSLLLFDLERVEVLRWPARHALWPQRDPAVRST